MSPTLAAGTFDTGTFDAGTFDLLQALVPVERMLRALNAHYGGSGSVYGDPSAIRSVVRTTASEIASVRDALTISRDQAFVRSADFALTDWEILAGIALNPTFVVGDRQDRVVAALRGPGTTTLAKVRTMAQSFALGDIRIAVDAAGYTAYVIFADTRGVPANLQDLKDAIERVLPARLAVVYVYRFLTYNEMAGTGRTYAQITADALTYTQLLASQPGAL